MTEARLAQLLGGPQGRARPRRAQLYPGGIPVKDFNLLVRAWLRGEVPVREHQPTKAFDFMRRACDLEVENLLATGAAADRWLAQRALMSDLTTLMFGDDISGRLASSLSSDHINPAGFRNALSQSVAKNTGENFVNGIVYALAACLGGQDDILVDKGTPPPIREYITMHRSFAGSTGAERTIDIPVECDIAIWSRAEPHRAILINAKTRLKEIFHIGTMWKLLYDMLSDEYCLEKWELKGPAKKPDMYYVFATADMVRKTGTATQGPDVEREEVRNLIAMDSSFFDYTFVSKSGIGHVSKQLVVSAGRESLFHELGCILDLIEHAFPEASLH